MMYKIEYLPVALYDLVEIATYIGVKLDNPSAADRLAEDITDSTSATVGQPYIYLLYIPIKPLKPEYRKIVVRNYDVFYRVDEPGRTITIARVIYAGRNIRKLLK